MTWGKVKKISILGCAMSALFLVGYQGQVSYLSANVLSPVIEIPNTPVSVDTISEKIVMSAAPELPSPSEENTVTEALPLATPIAPIITSEAPIMGAEITVVPSPLPVNNTPRTNTSPAITQPIIIPVPVSSPTPPPEKPVVTETPSTAVKPVVTPATVIEAPVVVAENVPEPVPEPIPEPVVESPKDDIDAYPLGTLRQKLLSAINAERSFSLSMEGNLNTVAQNYAQYLCNAGLLSHTGPNGERVNDRIKEQGGYTPLNFYGENLARGYENISEVMQGWLASSTHAGALKSTKYTHIGIGNCRSYWVAVFASKKA